ncbi:unnamed protein product, partial [Musa textilis]
MRWARKRAPLRAAYLQGRGAAPLAMAHPQKWRRPATRTTPASYGSTARRQKRSLRWHHPLQRRSPRVVA